ncbi:hypothetical protein BJQ94_00150 [Cryobacterium sp. SO2]|uniref:hypothetical protein n=1 Tax=Cryobacterium sp. SO2 TaxID=1897060 RepID=UPI00223CD9D0|nr:hypothetical protein [Cryobacterium sp. SO2]WEO77508.1 hypothetical protein BJQ94_00150 [Cryobacterium sp. SO2]
MLLALAVTALSSCAYVDPRASLDPLDGFASEVYLLRDSESPMDVSDTVCEDLNGCEKAAESTSVRLVRFDSPAHANDFAESLGHSAYQSDRFVIQYLDLAITTAGRDMIEVTVDNTASDSPD